MNHFLFIFYSVLSLLASAVAWLFYFIAHHIAKFSDAWELYADHHFRKTTESA